MTTLMWLIPAMPLLATLVTAAFGARVLKKHSHWPAVIGVALAFVFSLILLAQVSSAASQAAAANDSSQVGYAVTHTLWTWASIGDAFETNDFRIDVTLRADPLTCIMLSMVTFVSLLVTVYSIGYMHEDPGYWRFFTYIPLFVFSMTMLVSVSNFLLLYVFWEAVGVCSYLLIGFWYQKPSAAAAGKKAFLVNRIGDFGFALGVFLIWFTFGTLNFHDTVVEKRVAIPGVKRENVQPTPVTVAGVLGQTNLKSHYADAPITESGQSKKHAVFVTIGLLLLVGCCGKSAQFPLHVWLPDAMEGPSPVSALIHAATMVTAGVYLIARCAPLFAVGDATRYVVATVGGVTALMAAIIAVTQTDLKRILAYSTISQLGYMFLSLGTLTAVGVTAGMFHLFTHAFFKALLFLGAGSVMHAMGNVIDIRRFGGLRKLMPVTHWTFLFGCLALAGIVPFAGFWSKDAILGAVHEQAHSAGETHGWIYAVLYYMGVAAAGLTAFYTFRAFFLTFYGEEQIPPEAGHHAHESGRPMTWPLMILAVCAAGVWLVLWSFAGLLNHTPSLAYQPIAATAEETGLTPFHWSVAIISTLVALGGVGLAALLYLRPGALLAGLSAAMRSARIYDISFHKFYLDEIYSLTIVWPLRIVAYLCYFLDRFLVDGLVNFCGWIPRLVGSMLRPLQTGLVQFYALAMALGTLVLIWSLLLWK